MSVSAISTLSDSSRTWMEIGRPDSWSRWMDVWKERECFGVVIMVALAPWEAKTLAMSIMGIWWPPPTNGKKNISTGGEFKSIVAEGMDVDESLAGKREREPSTL